MIHNIATMLIEDVTVLPVQFFPRGHETGELALMRGVIETAMNDLLQTSPSKPRRRKKLEDDAREFFLSNDESWVFSFCSICRAFGLEPEYVRKRLFAYVEHRKAQKRTVGVYQDPKKVNLPFRVGDFWSDPGHVRYSWFATAEEAGEFYQQMKENVTNTVA